MKNLKLSLLLLPALLLLTSCEKEDENDGSTFERVEGTLSWSGDYAVDGCGFQLQVGEQSYKPINEEDIADSYKSASPTPVEVKMINFNRKEKVPCGLQNAEKNIIKILDIRRRE
ncbi:MAG: hypothetical protein LPK14_03850 [Hymenobacteraceae bacterium]|mgnify:FL=1|nr:hypothetical protein [Hymenobacteraceae bacterium]